MKYWSCLKPYLRWVILGGMLFFLAKVLKDHWQEVASIRLDGSSWVYLAIALSVTLLAHIWTGWVWGWILQMLDQPVPGPWAVRVYLTTNIAKYIPGNIWHYYGRIQAGMIAGIALEVVTVSVLLELLLLAAAALLVAFLGAPQAGWALQGLGLAVVLTAVHPAVLNVGIQVLRTIQGTGSPRTTAMAFRVKRYPLQPLLGEVGFLGLRGAGFLSTLLAFGPINSDQILLLLGSFSLAWLLGLVVPGAPGGVGVFEATAIALLGPLLSPGVLLGGVALYRLISVLAEAAGAGLAWLSKVAFRRTV